MPGKYTNSKGIEQDIDSLPYTALKNKAEKLRRMGDPSRAGELANMDARLHELEEQYRQEHPEGQG